MGWRQSGRLIAGTAARAALVEADVRPRRDRRQVGPTRRAESGRMAAQHCDRGDMGKAVVHTTCSIKGSRSAGMLCHDGAGRSAPAYVPRV